MHVSGTQLALARMRVWNQLSVSWKAVEMAEEELEDKGLVVPCEEHEDCCVVLTKEER